MKELTGNQHCSQQSKQQIEQDFEQGNKQAADSERLAKQLAFALEIDKEKNIFRQTHLSGRGRNENDAEHAWNMPMKRSI